MAVALDYAINIIIYPILTIPELNLLQNLIQNKDVTIDQVRKQGSYLTLGTQKVDNIQIVIDPITYRTVLIYQNQLLNIPDKIYIDSLKTSNGLFNVPTNSEIKLIAQTSTGYYNLNSILVDLFRANDFMSIQLVDKTTNQSQYLCNGIISSPIGITYDRDGLNITINIENYISYLDRIDLIQIRNDQYNLKSGVIISPISAEVYKFGEFFTKILNETFIPLNNPTLFYHKGVTKNVSEIIGGAQGSNGTAIGSNTSLYIPTTPTQSKLTAIKETIYPTHKIFWCDNAGDFHLTPLQEYFNQDTNWTFTLNAESGGQTTNNTDIIISASNISIRTNTATVYNRSIYTLFGINILLNKTSGGTSAYQNAVSVATVQDNGDKSYNGKKYFPRFVDLYNSTKAFITTNNIQEISNDVVQNAGLLNLVNSRFKNLQGLKSIYTINDNSAELTPTVKGGTTAKGGVKGGGDLSKNLLPLYASKELAESLFNDKLINITFDMNLAYNPTGTKQGFKQIPLGELVRIPTVTNNLFDKLDYMFCYGYNFSFDRAKGLVCSLMLCKPNTYTALWCDRADVFDSTPLGKK